MTFDFRLSITMKLVQVGAFEIGAGRPLAVIAGPCVIESQESALRHASLLKEAADRIGVPYIFKSSYDKANRSSGDFLSRTRAGKRIGDPCRGQA